MAFHHVCDGLGHDVLDLCLCVHNLDLFRDGFFLLYHDRPYLFLLFLWVFLLFLWVFLHLSSCLCLRGGVCVLFCVSCRRSGLVPFVFSRCGSDCGSVYLVTRQLNYIENFVHLKQNMWSLSYLSSLCFFFFLCVSERGADSSRRLAISCY